MGHEEIQVYTVKLRGVFMAYCDAFCFAFRSLSLFLELVQVQQGVFQEAGGESLTGCLETTMRCSCQSSGFEEVGSDKSCGSNAGAAAPQAVAGKERLAERARKALALICKGHVAYLPSIPYWWEISLPKEVRKFPLRLLCKRG